MSDYQDRFDYRRIPEHMMQSLHRYIEHGIPPGGFLTAVLGNDLKEAVNCADDTNIRLLDVYVCWLYNEAPIGCWGSYDSVRKWSLRLEDARRI